MPDRMHDISHTAMARKIRRIGACKRISCILKSSGVYET